MAACLAFHEWQWSQAEGEFQRAIALDPGYATARAWYAYRARVGLAEDYAAIGRPEPALAEMRQADADGGGVPPTRAALGHLYAKLGRVDEARRLLAEITARARTEYASPMDRAVPHADLGEKDAAFERLERAYEERVPALSRIKATGSLKGPRSDPRFEDLLRRMKLL